MAISIVLAILVALLVSMASLNITTTQSTVSQREAYIQAKSAIAFAESYYKTNDDQIPGNADGGVTGEALMVFKDSTVSNGASVYVTKVDATDKMTTAEVQTLKDNCPDTYVEVLNTGSQLDLTAYCKYGDGNAYKLSKEYTLKTDFESRGNAYTGNVLYSLSSESRYLRIHVRANDVFGGTPYLYTWYNDSAEPGNVGSSQFVNKLTGDSEFKTQHPTGVYWDPATGPVGACAMSYEGNGWYVTEFSFGKAQRITYLSAIITKPGAVRSAGYDKQSWEFFGIPVPTETGEANGADVYISLNKNTLQDAQNSSRSPRDDLTYYFEVDNSANLDKFAQYSSKWYTVYTKKDTVTVHYRKQGITDESCNPGGGFLYEGYGWWRDTTSDLGATISVAGSVYSYSDSRAAVISQNVYGRERITELFVCEADDGSSEAFGTEAEANDWFVSKGDTKAGDYVTVNVKASGAPVNAEEETRLFCETTIAESSTDLPTPGDVTSTDTETGTATSGEELIFEELSNKTPQTSGAKSDHYMIVGSFPGNDWARNGNGSGNEDFDYTQEMEETTSLEYRYTYTELPAGHYEYKIVKTDNINKKFKWEDLTEFNNGGGSNFTFDMTQDGDLTIVLTFSGSSYSVDAVPSYGSSGSTNRYTVIGWMNDWGRDAAGDHLFENTNEMNNNGDGTYTYTESGVAGGQTVTFKVMQMLADSGSIDTMGGWANAWGGTGSYTDADGNFVLEIPGDPLKKYNVVITFNEVDKSIHVDLNEIVAPDYDYYLVGTFNNFADHLFETAENYKMELTGTDGNGNPIYKFNIGLQEPNTTTGYEVKVISSQSKLDTPDADGKTINYDYSWGHADASGVTLGSDKAALYYTLEHRSIVEVTFTYDKADPSKSRITYLPIEFSDSDTDIVGGKNVGFYNDKLVNVNDSSQTTEFTTPWAEVYATYISPTAGMGIVGPVTSFDSNHMAWFTVPSDSTEVYFSNMPMEKIGEPGYEYTEKLTATQLKDATSPVFFPISSTDDAKGNKKWSMGDTEDYINYTSSTKNIHLNNERMAYTGSSQVNYYDAPMVKILKKLVGGGGNYAFSCYKYSKYDNTPVGAIYFDGSHGSVGEVQYQGETYYYVPIHYSYSFMILQTKDRSKGNIILENHFASLSSMTGNRYGSGWSVDMDNRAGAVFTSSGEYYDGTTSPNSYGGFTPNWYTYKIPTTGGFVINKIQGVISNSHKVIDHGTQKIVPVKASSHYNQPIYIYENSSGDIQYFTYDTSIGNVDTNSALEVSVYFENTEGWDGSSIKVHAYSGDTSTDESVSIDTTSADNSYYKFTFDEGKYCYFVFYDSSTGDWETATKKTGVLYLTGSENEDREYQILARGSAMEFSYYLHPKTAALYAYKDIASACSAATILSDYTYSGGKYNAGTTLKMSGLESQRDAAKTYAENGSGGKWSRSAIAGYEDLGAAARAFTTAVSNSRVYISNDPTTSSDWIFPEYELKDEIIVYEERWVNTLRNIYNQAMAIYNNTSDQNAANLWAWANELNLAISNPQSRISDMAVQIIVDDQLVTSTDTDGTVKTSGNWGKSNLHLYSRTDSTAPWVATGSTLLETTQSQDGFYAFAFAVNPSEANYEYTVSSSYDASGVSPKDTAISKVVAGSTYFFHTGTETFEKDDTPAMVNVIVNTIEQSGATDAWGQYTSPKNGDSFTINFLYDTTVKTTSNGTYTIYAGAYAISKSSYKDFTKDFSGGKTGINLFSAEGKKFFTDKVLGFSTTKNTYEEWNGTISGTSDIDIMVSSIGSSASTTVTVADDKRINFRFKNEKDNDTLTLDKTLNFKGGIVSMAVNNIDLRSQDVLVETKTLIFYTDTVVKLADGSTYKITHGTYVFNESSSPDKSKIRLSDKDWKNHYTLVDASNTSLKGGTYVAK